MSDRYLVEIVIAGEITKEQYDKLRTFPVLDYLPEDPSDIERNDFRPNDASINSYGHLVVSVDEAFEPIEAEQWLVNQGIPFDCHMEGTRDDLPAVCVGRRHGELTQPLLTAVMSEFRGRVLAPVQVLLSREPHPALEVYGVMADRHICQYPPFKVTS